MRRSNHLIWVSLWVAVTVSCEANTTVSPQIRTEKQNASTDKTGVSSDKPNPNNNANDNQTTPNDTTSTTVSDKTDRDKQSNIAPQPSLEISQDKESDLRGQALITMRRYGHNDPKNFFSEESREAFSNDLPAQLVAPGETIKSLAMLNYHSPVRDQVEDGPCGAYAMSAAAENFMQKHYIEEHIETNPHNFWKEYQSRLNTELIYAAEKDYYFKTLAQDGISFLHSAKLEDSEFLFKTSQVMDAIDAGHPVVMGTLINNTWYSSASNANNGLIECRETEDSGGGHFITILGYAIDPKE